MAFDEKAKDGWGWPGFNCLYENIRFKNNKKL
jgi:hypothetical protein